jgi:tryptophan 7-halogenase
MKFGELDDHQRGWNVMATAVRKIVIVGGGTAGWLTAGTIAAHHKSDHPDAIQITLIESPDVPIIGVGEGTWPTMRGTLEKMGISETDFIRECDATFKQGADFRKWVTGAEDDHYYHPLVLPSGFLDTNLAPHWMAGEQSEPFAQAVSAQPAVCDAHLAPKQISTPEFAGVENYAYHLNAGKFSTFLTKHCVEHLGVRHILDHVQGVNTAENGDISSVRSQRHGDIEGDLFIDCTGFKSLLLGEHFGVPFKSCADTLFIDTALAVQVPYETEDAPIASHTISTAQSAGWIWDIGLPHRRGVGHVFSSRHINPDHALEELQAYLRPRVPDIDSYDVRTIRIKSGHREKFWERNCVAVGLSAGFLEPLEASALVLVELSAQMIAHQMPTHRAAMDIVAARFNRKFRYRWDRIIDFLKLHYVLTKRTDSKFWIDNVAPDTIPESLKELLTLWRYQYPWHDDFDHKDEVFPAASYQYILYGMGHRTAASHIGSAVGEDAAAQRALHQVNVRKAKLLGSLPTNRDLIDRIKKYGLQRL